jgi:two-component system, NarL family, sensor histidine kinase NreB
MTYCDPFTNKKIVCEANMNKRELEPVPVDRPEELNKVFPLRRHTKERALAVTAPLDVEKMPSGNVFELIDALRDHQSDNAVALPYKLLFHQIELQLQNQDLQTKQKELNDLGEKYSALFLHAPMGYLITDRYGAILDANEAGAEMLAADTEDLIRQNFQAFILPEYRDTFCTYRETVFNTMKRHRCELKLLDKNGGSFFAQLMSTAVTEPHSTNLRQLIAFIDVTDVLRADAFEKANKKAKFISSFLMTLQEKERKRLALELHDALGQSIVLLIHGLRKVQAIVPPQYPDIKRECAVLESLSDDILNTVRNFSKDLTPFSFKDFSLNDALQHMASNYVKFTGIPISLNIRGTDDAFARTTQVTIYRIIQEAVTNALKHSKANRISVSFGCKNGGALFIIKDDGIGFDSSSVMAPSDKKKAGLGLISMEERVDMLKGQFEIKSRPSKGTQIRFYVPIQPRMKD